MNLTKVGIYSNPVSDIEINVNTNQIERKGMALPFVPLSISFKSVSYYIDMPLVSPMICSNLGVCQKSHSDGFGC
jgi:hypothetical protein